ncbi:pathway-specific regulatory nit-4 [Fusarium beomiforme]|uniref:Pathway-specific regulatory nit-4 n=1 Tax=Fusarium beomiforme TaxID=44412 RepID=A0A9P5DRS5_9HYPO|nr:pathway-specific regulatory nit-4 [Fusarium beomiforme]
MAQAMNNGQNGLPLALERWEKWEGQDPKKRPGEEVAGMLTQKLGNEAAAQRIIAEAKTQSEREVQEDAQKVVQRMTEILVDEKASEEYKKEAKREVEQKAEARRGPRRCYVNHAVGSLLPNTTQRIERENWFETEPLSAWDIANIASLQLVTYSKGGLNDPHEKDGLWSWFELSIRGESDKGTYKKLPSGQSLAWFSHANAYNDETIRLRRGRIFTREDDMFQHLMPNDRISVSMAACIRHGNVAHHGYLLLGFENDVEVYQRLRFPATEGGEQEAEPAFPSILVCGQKRQECFMITDDSPSSKAKVTMIDGGVRLMRRLLEDNNWSVLSSPPEPAGHQAPVSHNFHSIIQLAKDKRGSPLKVDKQTAVTAGPVMVHNWQNPEGPNTPRVVVWDDFGVTKENIPDYVLKPPEAPQGNLKPKVLIYQMHAPLCEGVLWKSFRPFSKHEAESQGLPTVLVVIDMDDLRGQGFNISRGISWEKTMEDFRANLETIIDELKLPRGPRPRRNRRNSSLTMVPNMAEGDLLQPYDGQMPGIDIAFVTGLAASLVKESDDALGKMEAPTVGQALELAIIRSHRFVSVGFRKDATGAIDYPKAESLTNAKLPKPKIIFVNSNWFKGKEDGQWSLFTLAETWKDGVAAETVKTGTKLIEACVPTAQYGPLKTADRAEIEGFRSAEAVIKQYIRGNVKKPLSIAVFGQPGSGKSFGVKEVIKAVLYDKDLEPIEANLSQFVEYKDLVGIFDSVRDISSKGKRIPVVLFDEFDSEFGGKSLGWLKYFLAPMQDNQYLYNGAIRSLGRAIFVFIGGTSSTFEDFSLVEEVTHQGAGGNSGKKAERKRAEKIKEKILADKQAKKPDFISRLSAHINVAGPNETVKSDQGNNSQGNQGDQMVIMRRAILLRSLLERRLDLKDKVIEVDETLLMALLKHPKIPHGSRSLELILQMSRVSSGQRLGPSALPPDSQLGMHLNLKDYKESMKTRLRETEFRPIDIMLYNKMRWAAWAGTN